MSFGVSRLGQIIACLSCVVGGFNSSIAVLGTLLGVWFGRCGVIERCSLGVLSSFLPPLVVLSACFGVRVSSISVWLAWLRVSLLGGGVCGLGE